MKKTQTETEPFSAAYLNCADLVRGYAGLDVRLHWIVRYAPDRLIRRYVQDSLDRFHADISRPFRRDEEAEDDE